MRRHLVMILPEEEGLRVASQGIEIIGMFTVECRYNYFFLRRAILLLHTFVRQNVLSLTAATFGDWLSPRAQAHYNKSRTNTIGLNDDTCLITAVVESTL